MISYTGTKECRSRFISEYFGDVTAKDCGVCDNCLNRKKSELSSSEFDAICNAILTKVSSSAYTVEKLLNNLPSAQKEKWWKVIQFLQAEKKLVVDKNNQLAVLH